MTRIHVCILYYTNRLYLYIHVFICLQKSQPDFVMILFRLGRGVFSISKSIGFLFLLQLPLTGALQNELMTRNAWGFLQNSCTFGLSCVPPL